MKRSDIRGNRYGKLVAVERIDGVHSPSRWRCRCDCGNEPVVALNQLTGGKTRSCGCLAKGRSTRMSKDRVNHGLSRTGLYRLWGKMVHRCENPGSFSYPNYGARGIKVCAAWRGDFMRFAADMGERPSPRHSIERRDNNGDYCPENCYWATPTEQARNRRNNRYITINGERLTLSQWIARSGLSQFTVRRRINSGWPVEKLFDPPRRRAE